MQYSHTQRAPLHYLLHAIGFSLLISAWFARGEFAAVVIICSVASLMVMTGLMFTNLTLRDEGEFLDIAYGPLPVFRKQIRYCDLRAVEPCRTQLIDGWGIHWVPGRGWTYNLWGFDCVKLDVKGRTIRVGSDDVDQLTQFLAKKITPEKV